MSTYAYGIVAVVVLIVVGLVGSTMCGGTITRMQAETSGRPQEHRMSNGDTCYTFTAGSLSCTPAKNAANVAP